MYKKVLYIWLKGTGSGSGVTTMFEGWSDDKLKHFDIDIDNYDHTDVANRSAVLMESYGKQKTPFLTVIHLWDKMSDYLLSSNHDPLQLGPGEPGMYDPQDTSATINPDSISISLTMSPKKGGERGDMRMLNW